MEISRRESYRILEIDEGSSKDEVRSAYKRQALKWHPDKHKNSPEATQKFQDISSAYERLMKPEAIEISLTMDQMFDLFAHVFCGNRGFSNGFYNLGDSDSDSSNDFSFRPDSFRERSTREKEVPSSSRPTVSEAKQHEEELLKDEEKLKKQKEKRRERKKRRKAKKKQEKEVRYGGGDSKKKGKKEVLPESSEDEEEEEEEEEIVNKENIQVNDLNGDSSGNSHNDKSSKAKPVNGNNTPKVADPTQTNLNSHLETNSNHRKEVHDGHQQAGGRGTEGVGSGGGGGGDAGKQTEGKRTQTQTKKSGGHRIVLIPGSSDSESDEETQGLDMNSAFFARAASGIAKKQTPPPAAVKTKKKGKGRKDESESLEDMDPQILESRKLAVKGNEMANEGNYHSAVKFFSKAIDLNPKDFRFFGNRSFCYDHLQMYDHALSDADQAILLDKTWPKGHYRKGRALSGLKLYTNAEAAFEHVLKLDKNCAEAVQELRTVRVYRLVEMGFGAQQSEAAILQFDTVPVALENLLAQGDLPVNGEMEEVYVSDDEDYITQTIQESKLDCRNPENLKSLWIGNLQPTVSEKELKDLFKPFGEVSSMRRMPEKFCAFVNYKDPRMASKAMDRLQGRELHGKHLLIKFPDNPIEQNSTPANNQQEYVDLRYKNLILRKPQAQATASKQTNSNLKKADKPQLDPGFKMSGPVNGDECYFWRTTGCWYAERCRYKHLPDSKGLDKK